MKKFLALVIVAIMMFTLPTQAMAANVSDTSTQTTFRYDAWAEGEIMPATSYYTMATYYDTNFLQFSQTKSIYLETFCVQVTYRCTMENATSDVLFLVIDQFLGSEYDKSITITADGNSHTMDLYLPAGNYSVHVIGTPGILHTAFAINFKGYA